MPSRRPLRRLVVGAVVLVAGLPVDASAAGTVGTEVESLAVGDFDRDGLTDYVYGYPKWNTGKGKVVVVYGSEKIEVWNRDTPGILATDVNFNHFGDSVAVGDFDGDRYDDLAIGVPGDDESSGTNVGSFHVIYGSSTGLTSLGDQIITQDTIGIANFSESYDDYGEVLATGDFNCDGFDDLAVGIPQEDGGSDANVGAVNVIYGSSGGLSTVDDWFTQATSGAIGTPTPGENFGGSLLAANFNGDTASFRRCDDLAIGIPGESSIQTKGGAVQFFYGASSGGLSTNGTEEVTQNSSGVEDSVEYNEQFATFLNAATFVDDAYDDIVVRAPYDTCGLPSGAQGFHFLAGGFYGVVNPFGSITDSLECVYVDARVQSIVDAYWACILDLGVCHCSDEFSFAIANDTSIAPLVQIPWMCTVKAEAASEFCELVTPQSGPTSSPEAADCIEASTQAWKDCLGTEVEKG